MMKFRIVICGLAAGLLVLAVLLSAGGATPVGALLAVLSVRLLYEVVKP